MIAIVDYDAGNIRSVCNALGRLGAEYSLTADPSELRAADKVILPGVGNAREAMDSLRDKGLCELIKNLRKPVLGICVGMQLLCRCSEEGPVEGLGIFDAQVRRFQPGPDAKVPHMGWNAISNLDSKLFGGVSLLGHEDAGDGQGADSGSRECPSVYFVHSYYPTLGPDTIATCVHGSVMFSSALKYENFYGTQFHPEKSGKVGEMILRNFIGL